MLQKRSDPVFPLFGFRQLSVLMFDVQGDGAWSTISRDLAGQEPVDRSERVRDAAGRMVEIVLEFREG